MRVSAMKGVRNLIILAIVLVERTAGEEKEVNIYVVKAGESVCFSCTRGFVWRGPMGENETTVYFDGKENNPTVLALTTNMHIFSMRQQDQYDLCIANVSMENKGVYVCQYYRKGKYDDYIIKKYRLHIYANVQNDKIPTETNVQNDTIPTETSQRTGQFPWLIILIAIIPLLVVVILRKRVPFNQCIVHTLNFVLPYIPLTRRTDELSTEVNFSNNNWAVENVIYQSSTFQRPDDPDVHMHGIPAVPEIFFVDLEARQGTAGSSSQQTNGRHVQMIDPNLHYAEIIHTTAPPGGYREIHGIENRTVYSEINHLLSGTTTDMSRISETSDIYN